MPREVNPKIEQAKILFEQGIRLVEIAEQLDVPEGTVRSWKNRHKWQTKENATLQQEKCNVAKGKGIPKIKTKNKPVTEVEQLDNSGLTDKQKLFCVHYIKCFNATKAYQKAYGVDYTTAVSIAYRLMENDGIVQEIKRLKQAKLNRLMFSEDDLFQMMLDVACADIKDYVKFGRKDIEVGKTEEGEPITIEVNYTDFKESDEVDGSLISEIKQGKDGISVKLQDKMKAMQWLGDRMDLLPEATRLRLEHEKDKLKMLQEKHDKEMGSNNKEPIKIEFTKASEGLEDNE